MPARQPTAHLAALCVALGVSCLSPALAAPLGAQAALSDEALSEVRAAGWDALLGPWPAAGTAAHTALPAGATAEDPAQALRHAALLAEVAQADRQAQQLRQWAASMGVNGAISASGLAAMNFLAPVAPLLPVVGLPIFGLFPMLPPPKKG